MAFTAALCSAKRSCGWVPWLPHTSSWLSLPPRGQLPVVWGPLQPAHLRAARMNGAHGKELPHVQVVEQVCAACMASGTPDS